MYIVFDIGGTNMRVAGVEDGVLGEVTKVPTPKNPDDGIEAFIALAKQIAGKKVIDGAAGDVPGRIDAQGKIFDAKNLRQWEGVEIARVLSERLGAPVRVANDAAVVGLGELKHGAGKGFSNIVYITVSTGVGGAHVLPDDIMQSPILGELQLSVGDLEFLVSGTAVQKRYGIEPKNLDSLDERNKLADVLAQGLKEIVETWPCEAVIIGGSMITGVNPIPLERVIATLTSLMQRPPVIKMAELGDSGGLHGGMVLAGLR